MQVEDISLISAKVRLAEEVGTLYQGPWFCKEIPATPFLGGSGLL